MPTFVARREIPGVGQWAGAQLRNALNRVFEVTASPVATAAEG
jgi:hypothetical protein